MARDRRADPERPTVDARRPIAARDPAGPAAATVDGADGAGGAATTIDVVDSADEALAGILAGAAPGAAGALAPGTIVDRQYRIERPLGHGGMGVVFLARDLRLERDVALKVGQALSASTLRRLEREAVALARLSHPNVVVVHQVGELDGRVYIAMEHVAGGNAREWLAARPRTWREIVALYAAAGDGLAAAHAAGFVHRDFKPDNVLVGADGRPRVADFGLARGAGDTADADADADDTADADPARAPRSPGALVRVTQTGAVVGTPAYMAPEQLDGREVDARADQFAFCAALWEALFATRPFPGRTPTAVADAIATGGPRAGDDRGVPRRITAALRRGLARDAADRWPAMAPLVAELRRDPAARRRRVAIAAAVTVAAVAVTVPLATRAAHHDPCGDAAAQLAPTWNPTRAAAVGAAFDRAGAGQAWASLRPIVDRYARRWTVAHRDACRATRVDGSQSEAMMERRMLCLSGARAQLDAVLAALAVGGKDRVAGAGDAVGLLPDLDRCADVDSLGRESPPPTDPARRKQIEDANVTVNAAFVASNSGWNDDLLARSDRALAVARAAGWPPLVARATLTRAEVLKDLHRHDEAVAAYQDAAGQALAAGDDDVAGWSFAQLAYVLADAGDARGAAPWIGLARGIATRLGDPPGLDSGIANADGARAIAAGDAAAAVTAMRTFARLSRRAFPDDPFRRTYESYNLANALDQAGKLDEAAAEAAAAEAAATAAGGPRHPEVGDDVALEAKIALERGRIDDAKRFARRAVAIAEGWYGPEDPRVAMSLRILGGIENAVGDFESSRPVLTRALALDRRGGTGDDTIAADEVDLAIAEVQSGHVADALAHGKDALAVLERVHGPDDPELHYTLILLGAGERSLGHLDASRAYLERAVHVVESVHGVTAPDAVNTRIELSYTLVAAHRAHDAVALLAPAIALLDHPNDVPPGTAAELHLAYAKALWAAGGDRARIRTEAARSRDGYAALGDAFADNRDEAAAWLRAHGGAPP